MSIRDEELAREAKRKFLVTLESLTRECADNVAKLEREKGFEAPGFGVTFQSQVDANMAQYWRDRKQTLLEVQQLWTETIGG